MEFFCITITESFYVISYIERNTIHTRKRLYRGGIESQVINTVKGESYTKAEGDGRYQPKGSYQPSGDYATNSTVNSKFDAANSSANNRVPNTRKVNSKPLNADITITASDVGAYTKAESDTKIADAKKNRYRCASHSKCG